ncbi:MAG TPA: helix-turn-helix domain-containing protein, partial [Solirubrobacteraceae bacterium]
DLNGWRLDEARRRCLAPDVIVDEGEWTPGAEAEAARGGFGLLIVEGIVVRRVGAPSRYAAELLGPGDLLRPWQHDGEEVTLPFDVHFTVLERVRFAILDAAFAERAAPFPQVALAMVGRSMERSRTLAVNMAIVHYPQVRNRLLLMLWHLADRWGRVTPEGVRIALRLRHHMLADLVAVRRPSATAALQQLTREGLVQRDGSELILHGAVLDSVGELLLDKDLI